MDREYNRDYAIKKIKEFLFLLISNKIQVSAAYLFGSFASEESTDREWSDIDLAIVSDQFSGSRFDDNKKLIPIVIKVEPQIEIHPFTSEDFKNSPFAREEIIKKGIPINIPSFKTEEQLSNTTGTE